MCPQRGSCRQTSIMHCSMDRRSFGIRKGTACFANREFRPFAPDLQAERILSRPFRQAILAYSPGITRKL
jgi:hypothetical protein